MGLTEGSYCDKSNNIPICSCGEGYVSSDDLSKCILIDSILNKINKQKIELNKNIIFLPANESVIKSKNDQTENEVKATFETPNKAFADQLWYILFVTILGTYFGT